MLYFLYKTTNRVNGRIYFGIHYTEDVFFGSESTSDYYCGDTEDIREDLRRYGRDAFLVEGIHAFHDRESANRAMQQFLVGLPPNSYHTNSRSASLMGNQNALGAVKTEEAKAKISEKTKGEKNPFYGEKHTEETKKALKEFRKGIKWINNGIDEKQILKEDAVPDGWSLGRKKRMSLVSK